MPNRSSSLLDHMGSLDDVSTARDAREALEEEIDNKC